MKNNMEQAALGFLIRENKGSRELLLAMKKRGFGQGKWNGAGGRFDSKKDGDIFDTTIREIEEEIGVKVKDVEKVAILNFHYPYLRNTEKEWSVHVFLTKNWQGKPRESEEMRPKWFKIDEIPFDEMWPDDRFWLPKILAGEKIIADFVFKKGEIISSHNIKVVNKFA
jgi:8-oxo-dGTP pyrophosphatase MutT (NUDIX family)